VYKRPPKTTPGHAPGKEEKQETVKEMVQEILKIIAQKESVIYASNHLFSIKFKDFRGKKIFIPLKTEEE